MELDILINSAKNVHRNVKDLVGTEHGSKKISKGAGGDISRKIDLVAEETVLNTIKSYNFSPTVIGEECGKIEGKNNSGYLIMDAIDGTSNSVRGIPFFCCSLAFATEFNLSSVKAGVIIDLSNGDIYSASKGNGAFLNGNKINVNSTILEESHDTTNQLDMLIGVNVSGVNPNILNQISKLFTISKHVRHFGANALELCYFARGFLDAFVDLRGKIRATDMAAGYIIAKEAGGNFYTEDGSELDSELGVDNTMSFYAVQNEKAFRLIKKAMS